MEMGQNEATRKPRVLVFGSIYHSQHGFLFLTTTATWLWLKKKRNPGTKIPAVCPSDRLILTTTATWRLHGLQALLDSRRISRRQRLLHEALEEIRALQLVPVAIEKRIKKRCCQRKETNGGSPKMPKKPFGSKRRSKQNQQGVTFHFKKLGEKETF